MLLVLNGAYPEVFTQKAIFYTLGFFYFLVTIGVSIYMKDVVVDLKKKQMIEVAPEKEKLNTMFVLK